MNNQSSANQYIRNSARLSMSVLLPCFIIFVQALWLESFNVKAADPAGWQLVWRDEFNGANNSRIDSAKWTTEIGGNGWGNQELEYYTNRIDNAYQSGGSLVIKVIRENYTGTDNVTRDYTSARLITKNKFAATYGRFEARIKIPYGQGLWPAFWLLGDNIDSTRWPTCGEIDIMENIGREPATIHGTIHGPGYSGDKGPSSSYSMPNKQRFADSFHTFALEWEPAVIRFYCDGVLYKTRTPADLPQGTTWVYDHPFFIILNVAIGGGWPGNPDATTVFPQTMLVDYVRVYQRIAHGKRWRYLKKKAARRTESLFPELQLQ
jgi:beta-glucanase (GH16 family)